MLKRVYSLPKSSGTAIAAHDWDPPTQRREQLSDHGVGPILQEMEAGQHLEWKDNANCSPTYKGYWAQWRALASKGWHARAPLGAR
jgi:hypothetical protein